VFTMTAKLLTGSIAVALALSASAAAAGPTAGHAALLLAPAAAGQAAPAESQANPKQAQADELLRQARKALADNNLAVADKLIVQAEALGVDYGPLHFGDTPAKARRDLEKRKAPGATATAAAAPGVTRLPPVDPTAQLGGLKPLPANSPLEARVIQPGAMGEAQAQGGPAVPAGHFPLAQPVAPVGAAMAASAAPAGGPGSAASSNQLLLTARRALAVGDVRRAAAHIEQAKVLPVTRGLYDDTPEAVEALLHKHQQLAALTADQKGGEAFRRETNRLMLEQAEGLLRRGDFNEAERLAVQAAQQPMNYGPMDLKPEAVLQRIVAQRRAATAAAASQGAVVPASGQFVAPAGGVVPADQRASQAVYNPASDPTRNVPASNVQLVPGAAPEAVPSMPPTPATALIEQGEAALRARDIDRALQYFRQAYPYRDQLDPAAAKHLQERLQMLSSPRGSTRPGGMDEAAAKQAVLAKQVEADILHEESAAKAMCANDPKKALQMMEQTRKKVESAGLDPASRDILLRRLDRSLAELKQFIEDKKPQIEMAEKNRTTHDDVERQKKVKSEVQEKLAKAIDEYNKLMDEQRYAEAEVLAKQAAELDPDNPVAVQLLRNSKFVTNFQRGMAIQEQKRDGYVKTLEAVEESGIPFDDRNPFSFGDVREWRRISSNRMRKLAERMRHRSERELEIEQKLKTLVSVQFENMPLTKVIEHLGKIVGINIHLDPQGLADEGVTTDTPVSLKLEREISLKSALNLILQPHHLGFVIKDEVLKITSEQMREGQVYTVTYNVADLVVPIPNFQPSAGMGLQGAYHSAMANVGMGGNGNFGGAAPPLAAVASNSGSRGGHAAINPAVMAQMSGGGGGMHAGPQGNPTNAMGGFGPGGAGGGAQADFDSLIDLITSTVKPTSWDAVGGPGSIAPFETNLSLVISQTQEVHEQIVDLLEQLRRLQDLQVTIEVRFITLSDQFYERIGVDFNFDINSNVDRPYQIFGRQNPTTSTNYTTGAFTTNTGVARDVTDRDLSGGNSATVGLSAPGIFSADMDIPFRQGSYALAVPQFGGVPTTDPLLGGAGLGFAILSDIEAYFFINAAQGDQRTNVLQAPKVTLFNGQQAFVSDTSQSPFVISVIPVVGDFAAAQQPVIVVLSEGTFLTVQAVVSNDRRFVRLTVVPFFSKIGDVKTFTFNGKTTTTSNTSTEGIQTTPNDNTKSSTQQTTTSEGTNVQLPTFSFVTVTTTVSVPDGGTVLLGGIKRLNEDRREYGVPMLNKIPYVNRLFSNVGTGRQTQSLMMMVTPRIIIQEEEEDKLGIQQQ